MGRNRSVEMSVKKATIITLSVLCLAFCGVGIAGSIFEEIVGENEGVNATGDATRQEKTLIRFEFAEMLTEIARDGGAVCGVYRRCHQSLHEYCREKSLSDDFSNSINHGRHTFWSFRWVSS